MAVLRFDPFGSGRKTHYKRQKTRPSVPIPQPIQKKGKKIAKNGSDPLLLVLWIYFSPREIYEKRKNSSFLLTLCSFYQKVVLGKDQQKFPLLGKLIPLWLHHTSFTLRCSDTPCSSSLFFSSLPEQCKCPG